jgi:hypothetical protein
MSQAVATPDMFRQRLAEMIDLRHPLAVLASRLPWAQIEASLAPSFARRVRDGRVIAQDDLFGPSLQVAGAGVAGAGRPRLPIRLMASLLYLKHTYKLSDEELVERWAENVVWQHFNGMTFYEPRLPCDATQIGRFRTAIGQCRGGGVAQGEHRHGGGLQDHQARRVQARDRGHHGAGDGHCPPSGLAPAGDRTPQSGGRNQALRHPFEADQRPRKASSYGAR